MQVRQKTIKTKQTFGRPFFCVHLDDNSYIETIDRGDNSYIETIDLDDNSSIETIDL